jgi:hypothetical protein
MRHRQTIALARRLSPYLVHRETRGRLRSSVASAVSAARRTASRIGTLCSELARKAETTAPARSRRSSPLSLVDRREIYLSFEWMGSCNAQVLCISANGSRVGWPQHINGVASSCNYQCLPWGSPLAMNGPAQSVGEPTAIDDLVE